MCFAKLLFFLSSTKQVFFVKFGGFEAALENILKTCVWRPWEGSGEVLAMLWSNDFTVFFEFANKILQSYAHIQHSLGGFVY